MAEDPAEAERQELGFSQETVRGKSLRVVERAVPSSEVCVFLVAGPASSNTRYGAWRMSESTLQVQRPYSMLPAPLSLSLSLSLHAAVIT